MISYSAPFTTHKETLQLYAQARWRGPSARPINSSCPRIYILLGILRRFSSRRPPQWPGVWETTQASHVMPLLGI